MSSVLGSPRIGIFTHDAYGLGHIRRSLHIIQALSERAPQAAILLITGCPANDMLRGLPQNADFVKIPTIVTSGADGAKPPVLPVGLAELSFLRARSIREIVRTFAPDVFLVDNFPLGSRLELLSTLQELRRTATRTILGLRDIVDPPAKVQSDWGRDGIYEVLDRYYDRILVYGMREVLDAGEAYALPPGIAEKVHYCGYVTALVPPARTPAEVRAELGCTGPLVVATVGGGGDGFPLLETFLQAIPFFSNISAVAVTGEFMTSAERAELRQKTTGHHGVVVVDFVPDLPSYMAAADLVVAMGGYNTTAEILALRSRAIVVPRTWRSGEHGDRARAHADLEQLLRAQALEKLGLVDVLHPEMLSPERLAERMGAALGHPKAGPKAVTNVRGLECVTDHILAMAHECRGERHGQL
ncbi:MAG TPA: glycosyltransferase [Candidatus Tectomicrobia bacterium]|nr:glycosyltransferase [Candidatus Tectomicrobia bacterium]